MSKSLNQRRARHRRRPNPHDPIARVGALTRIARGTWLGLLSYLAFVGVTLMGVQDADFFIKERETALPLIGVSVPTNLFFYIAPALGAMLYIHMHLYLLKLWKALGELPSGATRPAGERIPPWIVSDMALAQRAGGVHAYPLRSLARWVAILSIFAAGPLVLAAFWWGSMPRHDEVLTILACGLPLFASTVAGWESWRALRRGGAEARHMPWRARAGWGAGLALLCVLGFLTTEGGITDRFLRPAQLQGVVFVETPPGWLPRHEAERMYRAEWCAEQGIPPLACGPGPLARDDWGERAEAPAFLPQQRAQWCQTVIGDAGPKTGCTALFAELDARYRRDWRKARAIALDALPKRDLSGADLRGAYLRDARMEGVDLTLARLEGANLITVRMEGGRLVLAQMEGANLSGARLQETNLSAARMEGARFRGAQMQEADLTEVRLAGTNLRDARMEGASLIRARMDSDTILLEAVLQRAALRSVNLSSVDVSEAQVASAFGDASVALPEGMPRPAHWPDWGMPGWPNNTFDTEWRKWRDDPEGYVPPSAPAD